MLLWLCMPGQRGPGLQNGGFMLQFVSEHPGAFVTLFSVSGVVCFALAVAVIGLLVNRHSLKKSLEHSEEVNANTDVLVRESTARDAAAKEAVSAAARERDAANALAVEATEERKRIETYLEGTFGALTATRTTRPDQRDLRPFVEALAAWAADEAQRGNTATRDQLVRQALRIICGERLVTPELMGKLPPALIEGQVRLMMPELLGLAPHGHEIITRTLGQTVIEGLQTPGSVN